MISTSLKVYGIIEHQGKFLFVQDLVGTRGWKCVGGHVEPGETLIQALQREAFEEVGITISIQRILSVQDFFRPAESGQYHMRLFFSCTTEDAEVRPQVSEIAQAQWFTPEEIRRKANEELYPDHSQVIRDATKI